MRKSLPKHNVIVGDETSQRKWLEARLQQTAVHVDRVTDDSILGVPSSLLHVSRDANVEVSESVKAQLGVWTALPLTKGSAGLNALIRSAPGLLGVPVSSLPKDYIQRVAGILPKKSIAHIVSAMWGVAYLLTSELPAFERWANPWDNPLGWLPKETDPSHRLNSLYRDLVGYVYVHTNQKANASNFGVSPSKQKYLANLKLPTLKVAETVKTLSRWKKLKSEPYQCALHISKIWNS